MSSLNETQMRAVYQMGTDNEIPSRVTKSDLTSIIAFLFKQLDWIEDGESLTAVEQEIQVDPLSRGNQSEKNSEQPKSGSNDDYHPSEESCEIVTSDASMDIENITSHDQNGEDYQSNSKQKEDVEKNDDRMDLPEEVNNLENCSSVEISQDEEILCDGSNKLIFGCILCDEKFSKEGYVAAHMWMKHEKGAPQEISNVKPFSCSHCEYKCTHSNALKVHERSYNGKTICLHTIYLQIHHIRCIESTQKN